MGRTRAGAACSRRGSGHRRDRPGFRPWAFWEWEVGEHPEGQEAEVLALAERDLLHVEEVEKLAEKRRYWDLNEECWRTEENAVELHERVVEILQSATGPR